MTKKLIYYTSDFMPQGSYEVEEDLADDLLATGQWSATAPDANAQPSQPVSPDSPTDMSGGILDKPSKQSRK